MRGVKIAAARAQPLKAALCSLTSIVPSPSSRSFDSELPCGRRKEVGWVRAGGSAAFASREKPKKRPARSRSQSSLGENDERGRVVNEG